MGIFMSFLLLAFRPDLSDDTCGEILALVPNGIVNDCNCDVGLRGFLGFGLEAEASCPLLTTNQVLSSPFLEEDLGNPSACNLAVSGEGSALGIALAGGSGDLSVESTCNIGFAEFTFSAEGEFETDSVEIDRCSISGTVLGGSEAFGDSFLDPAITGAVNEDITFECSCGNIGCEADDFPFFFNRRHRHLGGKGFVSSVFESDSNFLNADVSCSFSDTVDAALGCINLALLPLPLEGFLREAIQDEFDPLERM